MGHVGITASSLHSCQSSTRSLLLYHDARDWLLGSLAMFLAGALGAFLTVGFRMVVALEMILEGSLHPLALQIQKHQYISNNNNDVNSPTATYSRSSYMNLTNFNDVGPFVSSMKHNIMSGEEYTRKIEECRKQLGALKKDIQYRDEQVIRNEPTYALDAEIRGQFVQIDDQLSTLKTMLQNYQSKSKELSIAPREIEKRKNAYKVNLDERDKMKRMYDESLARRVPNSVAAKAADNMDKFNSEYKKPMDKAQLLALKEKQEKAQDDAIDDLIGTVKQMKTGQGQIHKELVVQDGLLDNLEGGIDENSENMSKIRRNLSKLLESSSYTCLILVILLEIAGIICNLILWQKK